MAILSSNVYLPVKYQAFPWKESQEEWISPKLKSIAEQLRRYRTPSSSAEEEGPGGVTSSVGMPASVASQNDLKVFPTKQRAAVLVCLHQSPEGELRVILTKRAGSLSSHSGEVALPGGKRDDEDVDDAATALREAREEIGLEPSHVRVVGHLEPFLSKVMNAMPSYLPDIFKETFKLSEYFKLCLAFLDHKLFQSLEDVPDMWEISSMSLISRPSEFHET